MGNSFEAFLVTPTSQRGEIAIGARSLYLLDDGRARLHGPEQPTVSLSTGEIAWVPAGVTHRLMMDDGECCVLRLRKGAFSVDQETDVQARRLLVQLDSYARRQSFILPTHIDTLAATLPRMSASIRDIIDHATDPFVAKSSALAILRHFVGLVPERSAEPEPAPAPARIRAFIAWLTEHHAEPITMDDALNHTQLSKSHFHRCFHDATGTSLSRYLNRERISVAKNLLAYSERSILDIALSCGFNSVSRFYEVFSQNVGCSPKEYKRQRLAPRNR
jgi:AraC-like DNA-binding protein/uncharacterized protein YjlB